MLLSMVGQGDSLVNGKASVKTTEMYMGLSELFVMFFLHLTHGQDRAI